MPNTARWYAQGLIHAHENARNAGRLPYKTKAPFGALATLPSHTASFAAFTGRALMTFRAGLALNSIDSLVKGLMPLRAMVAGFLERFPFKWPISRIREVCSAFRSRDLIKTRGDGLAEAPDGERGILQSICGNFAQERLEFGE